MGWSTAGRHKRDTTGSRLPNVCRTYQRQRPEEAAAAAACHALDDKLLRRALQAQAQSSRVAATARESAVLAVSVLMCEHVLGEGVASRQPRFQRADSRLLQPARRLLTG